MLLRAKYLVCFWTGLPIAARVRREAWLLAVSHLLCSFPGSLKHLCHEGCSAGSALLQVLPSAYLQWPHWHFNSEPGPALCWMVYARALPRGTVHVIEKQDGKVLENT